MKALGSLVTHDPELMAVEGGLRQCAISIKQSTKSALKVHSVRVLLRNHCWSLHTVSSVSESVNM